MPCTNLESKIAFNNIHLPETIPKALDLPQGEEVDELPNPLGNQEDTARLEGEVHRDFVAGIPVADHNYIDHPAEKKMTNYT